MDMTSINGASLAVITSTMIEPPRRFTDRMAGRAAQKIRTLELWTMALPLTKNSVPLKVDITGVPTLAALWNPPPVDPAAQPPQPAKKNTEARLAFDPLANHLIVISEAEMLRMKFNPNLNKLTLVSMPHCPASSNRGAACMNWSLSGNSMGTSNILKTFGPWYLMP
jgi:hypothetical protein